MKDFVLIAGWSSFILGVIFLGLIILLAVASLPPAFIGWIILSAVNIFTPVSVTYFNSLLTGLCISLVGSYFGAKKL